MDYLLLTNAFTKLRNENKTYEELENFALKLEISNIKYSQKHEKMKFEIIRLNQKIIDLNSIIKENEIETKRMFNQVNFLEKDREFMFSRIQTQELNFLNSENTNTITNTKIVQSQFTDQENNLLDQKYLVRTSNDLENNPLTGYISENSKENNFNSNISKNNQNDRKKNSKDKKYDFEDNKNFNSEENEKKKEYDSIIEDTDSSLIEGFENNESLLDSIKRREKNIHSGTDQKALNSIRWKDVLSSDGKHRKKFLHNINHYDQLRKENKKLQNEIIDCNNKIFNFRNENKDLVNFIKQKEEIIQILYKEIDSMKKDIYSLNQELNQTSKYNKSKNEYDKCSENNEISDISPTTPDIDSEYNSPALKKIKNFIVENSYNRNTKNQNTPSTVNKNYFYKNNTNYENFLNKYNNNNYQYKEKCKTNNLIMKNSDNKTLKSNAEIAKEKIFKKKYFKRYSTYENDDNTVKHDYQGLNTDFDDRPNSIPLNKNNFTFQENEIIRQNDSSNLYSYQNNNINDSDNALKCENDKKLILKSLEDLKKDLDMFLKDYGIKEQFNKDNSINLANGIDLQIEYKFKEIRYITVNLKKINIIFKSLFVEFTKNIAGNMDKINEKINKKLHVLQNKISFATGEIKELIL